MDARAYLTQCLRTPEEVDLFLQKKASQEPYDTENRGWKYDSELGWALRDAIRQDGVNGSRTFYHYEPSGCRRRVSFPGTDARIHTYGNSFTHCDQVNDGETWQEYLAAHLQEPVENYGVGGYGVYQAYRRMLTVERERPAKYIILNVYDDDNYRNLDAWRTIRFGRKTPCGYPLPHVRVDLGNDTVEERENACPTAADLYKLCDIDWVMERFADDAVLQVALAAQTERGGTPGQSMNVPVTFGVPFTGEETRAREAKRIHTRAALRATRFVLGKARAFCERTDRELFVVLSYNSGNVKAALTGQPRWDQELVDFLVQEHYPFLDLCASHVRDFQSFACDPDTYLRRTYIGHYAPAGNFFFAQQLRLAVAEWLEPKPLPYR